MNLSMNDRGQQPEELALHGCSQGAPRVYLTPACACTLRLHCASTWDAFSLLADAFALLADAFALLADAFALPADAFALPADAFALPADAFALPADAFSLPADAFALPADAFALPADAFARGFSNLRPVLVHVVRAD
eukprot:gene30387-37976_t